MSVGLRIVETRPEPDSSLIARAAKLPVANIGDVMNRLQSMRGGFFAYGGRRTFVGPALTVKARPGDNLFLHRAIDLARPGEVIVCDGGGDLNIALSGDLMIGHAEKRGVGALVLDGAVRDIEGLRKMDIGVWARGANPSGPYKDGPGEIGYPVACGGQVVMPGDLIAADEDGIVVIPRAEAAEVIAAAEKHAAKEAETTAAIHGGGWARGWVEETLSAKGVAVTR
ncbi:RraA family protein [Roseomonas sp. SSH11]|uniref:Putative 4-hydroxy-4-methyl-2-oxoglutarate aldolase n=1 Tax=Pararoseomonas baculiformis TaxID=2820812 RepID=A0ABS4AES5_9PROT|nr:RraA family protein [Pararoseomonas baculiformis]MBP0445537.1 RraA family protein [Pararoseomonas baculiformis]